VTCIVGWIHDGCVSLGGDAAAVSRLRRTQRVAPKVFRNGPMVIGYTTSFRMGDLLQHSLRIPDRPRGVSVDRYMRTTFVDAVRRCLADGGFKGSGEESGGTFLVGYEGRLFRIESDFNVGELVDGFDAIGNGAELARGAMAVLRSQPGGTVRTKLRRALEIAARYSGAVSPPFTIVEGGRRSRSSRA
jgi:hypothetical protein